MMFCMFEGLFDGIQHYVPPFVCGDLCLVFILVCITLCPF